MKNWNYIEGAKTGNGILDILKSEKPIKMKSSKGAIVTIHPDGSAAHQEKEGSQMAVHHHNSFKEAVEYYKNKGYTKTGNDTPLEYAHRKPKVINNDKTGAEEFFKQLSDDVKEREEKDDADIEKVGNAKDKNGKDLRVGDIVLVWTSAGERAGKVKEVSGDRITVAIRNEGDWSTPGKLADKVSNSKTGNEASDDKFAYVMREFDNGKLKTPDGKVVTDPAQAKAIAYSESKKTENGLARARKAIK